ncbi:TPA: conjugal transfer protein TraN [Aeromonas dhakensis]|uniref:conjugal transfer protein TraN n=1 Tax=Aeromonas dhakensis TaxID=196024 RepID=UPI002890C86C|nr:conjugal transfer protein TraN [Aeromonas dhakensis]
MMKNLFLTLLLLMASSCTFAANYVCGQDLDGDGEINQSSEYSQCLTKSIQEQSIPSESCRNGFTINGARCEKTTIINTTPKCAVGSFDPATQQCKNTVTAIKLAQCPAGSITQQNNTCIIYSYAQLTPRCDAGWYYQDGVCKQDRYAPPVTVCPTGFNFSSRWGVCRSPRGESLVDQGWCNTNIKPPRPDTAEYENHRCKFTGHQYWTFADRYDIAASSLSCPNGTLSGNMCLLSPNTTGASWVCPAGFNKVGDTCIKEQVVAPNYVCPAGMTDNGVNCVRTDTSPASWECPPEYKKNGMQCYFTEYDNIIYSCPSGQNLNANIPSCPAGYTYNLEYNTCRKSLGTSPSINGGCLSMPSISATEGPFFTMWSGTSCTLFSAKYAVSGVVAKPACISTRTEHYCPVNADSKCLQNNGGAECSPNKCIDLDTSPPIDEGNIDGSMLVNDGKKNEDGLCLDQMFIFNGRAQDCKMPGVSNAFKNCCKSEGKALSDDAGSLMSMSQTMSTVSHIYSAATEAYTAYNAAIQAGQTAAAAMNSGVAAAQNYMMVAFDPTSLAISVAIYVVMKYLATACDQLSMETALMNDSGYCHKVGTYCKKKIKFIGCVQKAQSHCCFNSKLARIIHEQGRPQLKTGINNWGSPESPLCRGFTPEEFQAVDFGKIDLTEYIDEIQKNATDEIQKNMGNITSDFLDQTH